MGILQNCGTWCKISLSVAVQMNILTGRIGWFGSEGLGKWTLPDSCCVDEYTGCGDAMALSMFNKEGCSGKFIQMVEDEIWIVGGVGLGLAAIQIFGILLSFCLARNIKKD